MLSARTKSITKLPHALPSFRCRCEPPASPSRRDTPIVAWHEVPGKASSKEPSRRVRYDRAQLIELRLNFQTSFRQGREEHLKIERDFAVKPRQNSPYHSFGLYWHFVIVIRHLLEFYSHPGGQRLCNWKASCASYSDSGGLQREIRFSHSAPATLLIRPNTFAAVGPSRILEVSGRQTNKDFARRRCPPHPLFGSETW
jgi:hypothetical protein